MKLIEKKCPNCGAGLEFSENDKSCKCSYCHRSFEIERDNDNINDYYLKTIEASKFAFIPIIMVVLIFVAVAVVMVMVISNQIKSNEDFFDNNNPIVNTSKKVEYFSSADELSNSDLKDIDHDAAMTVKNIAEGVSGPGHSFVSEGDESRQKVYVASKDDGNVIIAVYLMKYYNMSDNNSRFNVYIPIVYENVNKNQFVDKFGSPEVKAPEYYFNSDKSNYVKGYSSMDEVYNNLIKPLEKDYKISEK